MAEMGVRVAVVTGANRGVGAAVAETLCQTFDGKVVLTARSNERGLNAVKRLQGHGCSPIFHQLDISNAESRRAIRDFLNNTFGGLDVLVNNAASTYPNSLGFSNQVKSTLHVNFYSTYFLCQLLFPLLRPNARVVNLSSPCGHLSDIPSEELRKQMAYNKLSYPLLLDFLARFKASASSNQLEPGAWGNSAYCVSKVGITALTYVQQRQFNVTRPQDGIIVNCYAPGKIRSRITGYVGCQLPSKCAGNIGYLATLPANATYPIGEMIWEDRSVVDWEGAKPADL